MNPDDNYLQKGSSHLLLGELEEGGGQGVFPLENGALKIFPAVLNSLTF